MKRKINFIPAIIILGISAAVFWLAPYVTDIDFSMSDLSWSRYKPFIYDGHAPDDTAYVDILVKIPESSEDYTEFNELKRPPQKFMGFREVTEAVESETGEIFSQTRRVSEYEDVLITPESEIAKLNEDGYVSLSLHCKGVQGFQKADYSTQLVLTEQSEFDIEEIYKRYGNFKAAYVGDDGKVLKITDSACVEYNPNISCRFSTHGDALNFTICGGFSGEIVAEYAFVFCRWATVAALAVFIVLAVVNKIKFGKQAETEQFKKNFHFAPLIVTLSICVVVFPTIVLGTIFKGMDLTHDYTGSRWEPQYTFKNAPEGTAYVDLLMKLPENSEEYVDFAEWGTPPKKFLGFKKDYYEADMGAKKVQRYREYADYEELNITPESEIAKLNDDDYISLSVHYKGCEGFSYNRFEHECYIVLSGRSGVPGDYTAYRDNFEMIAERYGNFKAAYIGENGEVLKITKPSKIKHWSRTSEFSVNGDKLSFHIYKPSVFSTVIAFIALFGQLPALAGLIICIVLAVRQDKYQCSLPNLDARGKKHDDF